MIDWIAADPMLAKALITWTVNTFYIASAILQFIVIIIGFKLTHADMESNIFIGAAVVVVATAVAGVMTRDMGLVGLMITGSTLFGSLLFVSAGDALRSLVVTGICIALYAGLGAFLIPRTPLTAAAVGGFVGAFENGLDEQPLSSEEDLYEHTKKKQEESLKESE